MGTAYILVAALAIGGTVAYLTSTDSDVNVMAMGNVSIAQFEYERVVDENGKWVSTDETDKYGYTPDKLQEFTQDKPLYPAVFADSTIKWDDRNGNQKPSGEGSHQQSWGQVGASGSNHLFDDSVKNVQDKFVFVKNTGRSDAYVRTYIALEQGDVDADDFENVIMTNVNKSHWSWKTITTDVEINGSEYFVMSATYLGPASNPTGILAPGAVSYPSLLQIYMKPEATNEDVEALDGNDDGQYDILVVSQAVQADGFADAATALDEAFPVGDNGINLASWFGDAINMYEASLVDIWDGTVDTSWYNETAAAFTLTSAEQLAGLTELVDGGTTFAGKTINLNTDMDLYCEDDEGNVICFDPIGSYKNDDAFKGTFDGQGHTIYNLSQNTWALDNGYYYGDLGLGLFGLVEDATIKNLIMDGANISGESAICGTIAGCAYGDMTFENITVTNSQGADYQYYAGGIVGWASGNHKYINCDLDASTTIAAQWGDFDNSTGGVIGGAGGSATIYMKDCDVACRIDGYNDVTSSYQWYAYRRCGMLIGNTGKTQTSDGTTYAAAPQLTCENVTVTYGDWANYTYCEFAGQNWPYVRVQAGVSNSAYSNPRYGVATDANGNRVVDDTHVHNEGEDHNILCVFDQLYGGGQGVYGTAVHDGVTVIYNNK